MFTFSRISILSVFMLLGFSFFIKAQAPNFVTTISKSFGGQLKEEFFGGYACLDGGYFLTGLTYSVDGDINPSAVYDSANIFVVKTDSQGNKQWAYTFGGNDYDKARYGMQDADSNFLIVGTTHSIDGDITNFHGNSELFVLKLDPSGSLLWMKQYGGTGWESGRYILQTNDGNYLVAGYSSSKNFDLPNTGHGLHDGWIFKIDTAGTILWSKTYGGTGVDRIRHVIETSDGSLVFTGSSASNDFDCLGNKGGMDYWICKTDSAGNLLWSKLYGGSGEDWSYHIMQLTNSNFLITGYTYSNDGDITDNYGNSDAWIIILDSVGNLVNQKNFGGTLDDRFYKSHETSNGNILAAGFAQSSNYDLSGVNSGPSKKYWLASLDLSLNISWSYCVGGSGADLGKELIYNPVDSSIVIMGDSNSGNGAVLGNHGDFDFWMVKLDVFTSISQSSFQEPFTMYYQPAFQNLVIESHSEIIVEIIVNDVMGRNLFRMQNVILKKGTNTVALNEMGKQANGIYTVSVSGNSKMITKRIPYFRN